MKTIFLHIGPAKTGTTTIQQSLHDNEKLLLSIGYTIPRTGQVSPGQAGHHNLAWELNGNEHFNPKYGAWAELINELEDIPNDKIILSAEGFSLYTPEKIEFLKQLLQDYSVKVILYLRRQDLWLQSMWAEKLKKGENETFHMSLQEWIENSLTKSNTCDYDKLIENWGEVFGKENIIPRVLEKSQFKGTLFQDFLSACQVPEAMRFRDTIEMNISPGVKTLVLIREFKKLLQGKLDAGSRIKFYSALSDFATSAGWNDKPWSLIDQDIHAHTMKHFSIGNRQIAQEYFGRDELFLEKFDEKRLTRFSLDDFEADELFDVFSFIASTEFNFKQERDLVEENIYLKKEIEAIYSSRKWRLLESVINIKKNFGFRSN
jgi:hypothetical protein